MLTQINIKRVNGTVTFETVSINNTDNVFFTNLDTDPDPAKSTHWPDICDDKLPPSPPNSSQCIVPPPADLKPPNNKVPYKCKMAGHNETGVINVFAVLAPANVALANATNGKPIKTQQVVQGGTSPYAISEQAFEVVDNNNNVIDSGPGIGPGLKLNPDQTNSGGITVTGTPTRAGTYNFTFVVNDGMGGNLQQVQYSMKVV